MAQNDMNIANQGFPAFRADLNDQLEALVTNSSGATEPSTKFPHQFWVDTAADPSVLKIRNEDNDAWITIGEIDQTGDKFNLNCANATIAENLSLNDQGDLRFFDSDSSNYVAFQAPATVSSNVTWTLPATDGASGEALTTDGSGTLSWAVGGGGKVLQVVQGTHATEVASTSTSYVDSGLSASITPTSATSKILVLVNQQVSVVRNTNDVIRVDAQIVRDSTAVYDQNRVVGGETGTNGVFIYFVGTFDGKYLDSPNTTSSITYKTQGKVNTSSNGGTLFFQESSSKSTITLMEIAA